MHSEWDVPAYTAVRVSPNAAIDEAHPSPQSSPQVEDSIIASSLPIIPPGRRIIGSHALSSVGTQVHRLQVVNNRDMLPRSAPAMRPPRSLCISIERLLF